MDSAVSRVSTEQGLGFSLFLRVCVCVCGACWGQKRVLDPLELELWMVVRQYVGARS